MAGRRCARQSAGLALPGRPQCAPRRVEVSGGADVGGLLPRPPRPSLPRRGGRRRRCRRRSRSPARTPRRVCAPADRSADAASAHALGRPRHDRGADRRGDGPAGGDRLGAADPREEADRGLGHRIRAARPVEHARAARGDPRGDLRGLRDRVGPCGRGTARGDDWGGALPLPTRRRALPRRRRVPRPRGPPPPLRLAFPRPTRRGRSIRPAGRAGSGPLGCLPRRPRRTPPPERPPMPVGGAVRPRSSDPDRPHVRHPAGSDRLAGAPAPA